MAFDHPPSSSAALLPVCACVACYMEIFTHVSDYVYRIWMNRKSDYIGNGWNFAVTSCSIKSVDKTIVMDMQYFAPKNVAEGT